MAQSNPDHYDPSALHSSVSHHPSSAFNTTTFDPVRDAHLAHHTVDARADNLPLAVNTTGELNLAEPSRVHFEEDKAMEAISATRISEVQDDGGPVVALEDAHDLHTNRPQPQIESTIGPRTLREQNLNMEFSNALSIEPWRPAEPILCWPCGFCGAPLLSLEQRARHMTGHVAENYTKWEVADWVFETPFGTPGSAVGSLHGQYRCTKLSCKRPAAFFQTIKQWHRHELEHKPLESIVCCSQCGFITINSEDMRKHQADECDSPSTSVGSETKYACLKRCGGTNKAPSGHSTYWCGFCRQLISHAPVESTRAEDPELFKMLQRIRHLRSHRLKGEMDVRKWVPYRWSQSTKDQHCFLAIL